MTIWEKDITCDRARSPTPKPHSGNIYPVRRARVLNYRRLMAPTVCFGSFKTAGRARPCRRGKGQANPLFSTGRMDLFFITSVIIFSIFVLLTLWTTVLCIVVRGFTFQHYDDGGCIYFPFFQCFFPLAGACGLFSFQIDISFQIN